MDESSKKKSPRDDATVLRFEQLILPHLAAAYNLAYWLTKNRHDAEEVVQEACLRAFQFFEGFRGTECRAWLLTIVRNTAYTWLKQHRAADINHDVFDETIHGVDDADPKLLFEQHLTHDLLHEALEALPLEFREVVVMRDLDGLSYKEIADVTGLPIGTVMSRLSRGRTKLEAYLSERMKPDL
jgi:RNA polymerase sigma factor (sigma-70 family)